MVEKLQLENQGLMSRLAKLEEENRQLTVKNATLIEIQEKYDKLKEESGQFLALEAKYNTTMKEFASQAEKIEKLEIDSHSEIQRWYLIGPGVLIVGFIFGLGTRKKKKSSLL